MNKHHLRKKILIWSISIAMAIIALLLGAALYMQWYALEAQGNERGKNYETSYQYMFETYPFIRSWADSLKTHNSLRDTFITTDDGTKLHALYIYADSITKNTAVIVHGYTDNAVRMLHIGYLYNHDLHYNVLLPDLRFAGKSEGDHIQMGWKDRWDVMRWMDVANNIFSTSDSTETASTNMVVHGISMGAATTLCVSGEKQAPYVKCFIADCGYTSVWDEFSKELRIQFSLPEFPLLYITSWLTKLRYGWDFKEASPLSQIQKSQYPTMIIHGSKDTFVPTWMGDTLSAHHPGKIVYLTIPAEHALSYLEDSKEYTNNVKIFLKQHNR